MAARPEVCVPGGSVKFQVSKQVGSHLPSQLQPVTQGSVAAAVPHA